MRITEVPIIFAALSLSACVSGGASLPEGAVEVDENRVAALEAPNGVPYDMATYIVPFQNPYYITVKPSTTNMSFENGHGIAARAATAYIEPRGCTESLSRIEEQDRFNASTNTWTIVVGC